MTDLALLPAYLSGAFAGVCILVLGLSLVIGYTYHEVMLWWHAAAVATGLLAQSVTADASQLVATLWLIQMAFSAQALRISLGVTGAMRRPALALRSVSLLFVVLAASQLFQQHHFVYLLAPWLVIVVWYFFRSWAHNRPWGYWLVLGQLALALQWPLWLSGLHDPATAFSRNSSMAALAVFASAIYLAMVWASRLKSENALRVEAREITDPLTGLAMPRVFFDRLDGALIRSRNLGYACALVLIRVENIEKIVADMGLENNEAVILAASKAIASSLRPQDSAARLSGNRFGVMAEGVRFGEANELATKIVVQGLRAGEWGLKGCELQFQIAVLEIARAKAPSHNLLAQLEEALRQMASKNAHKTATSRICTLPRV